MSGYISSLEKTFTSVGEAIEKEARATKKKYDYGQYSYVVMPIYKYTVEKVGDVAATGITFLAGDLIMHQAFPQALGCTYSYILSPILSDSMYEYLGLAAACTPSYSYLKTLGWMAIAIPVMYAKYKRQ